jgi:hypothetical protein
MPDAAFSRLTDTVARVSRRLALGATLAVVAAAPWPTGTEHASAKHKRKRRKKKPSAPAPCLCPPPPVACPAGFELCNGVYCSPEKTCVGGQCQCTTACGAVCCLNGQVCLDEDMSTCGCTAGTCPVGCDCAVSAGGIRTCFESVVFVCEDLQPCMSNFDCPVGSACAPACDGAVCFPLCAA